MVKNGNSRHFNDPPKMNTKHDPPPQQEIKSNGSSSFFGVVLLILLTGLTVIFITDAIDLHGDYTHPQEERTVHVEEMQQMTTTTTTTTVEYSSNHPPEDVQQKPPPPLDHANKQNGDDEPLNHPTGKIITTENQGTVVLEQKKQETRHTYKPRGQPMSEKNRTSMMEQWGSWKFVDDDVEKRPKEDYYKAYPNRDIPRTDFPSSAWQIDKEYLSKFLPEGIALVQRAQEAILHEYDKIDGNWTQRAEMFHVTAFDNLTNVQGLGNKEKTSHPSKERGGWTTKKSWEGLKRRLLHAIMTEGKFIHLHRQSMTLVRTLSNYITKSHPFGFLNDSYR